MPETRRLCRKCYKRRKLDASGRCRHCNPSGFAVVPGYDSSTAATITTASVVPATAVTTSISGALSGRHGVSPPPLGSIRCAQSLVRERSDRHSGDNTSAPKESSAMKALRNGDASLLCAQLDNRAVQQMQMFNDFFTSHIPAASAAEVTRARRISYLANIPFLSSSSPLLSAAIDALCFAHVGSTRHDARLLHASQNSYGAVLASIRRMLSSSNTQSLSSREIVMAIMVISLFDECMPAQHRASNSSMTHLWGAQQYLTAISPSQFDLNHPLDRTLILNVFQNGFWLAIAKRQQVSRDRSNWTAIQDSIFPPRTPYTLLAQVPLLLEKTDKLLNRDNVSLAELAVLCHEIEHVRHEIATRARNDPSTLHPELVHITSTAAFDMDVEEHRLITHSPVFVSHNRFPSPEPAVNFACRAIVFVVLDCTLLRIFHFRPTARSLTSRRSPAEIEEDAVHWAGQLCQSVFQFSQLRSLAYIDFLILFMGLAHNFYQTHELRREAAWCQACLAASRARLERLRVHRPPTLCRLGDLPAGIKAAGNYRVAQLDISEASTADRQRDFCPMAMKQKGTCPVTGFGDTAGDFSTTKSTSSASTTTTTASSVSPTLSLRAVISEELEQHSNDGWSQP